MEINIERDGISNADEVTALIYYGRYPVNSWAELYYAAVKTLYIEYPEVINSLVSKDSSRALYLRTTTIDMKEPVRIATILYLDVARKPLEIVRALREIFHRAGVVNINMSVEVKRRSTTEAAVKPMKSAEPVTPPVQTVQVQTVQPTQPTQPTQPITPTNPTPQTDAPKLEVPSFMKSSSDSIRKLSNREVYIEQMKSLVKRYPAVMKKQAGRFLNNRRITLAESSYRYFLEPEEIGEGLSIELFFTDEDLKKNIDYYLTITKQNEYN